MSTISQIAKMKLYPLGDTSEQARISLVQYINKLYSYYSKSSCNINIKEIIFSWLQEDCIDSIELYSTIEIATSDVTYGIGKQDISIVPKELKYNDYTPVNLLLERITV